MPLTICLITPGHVSANPRLVKEADALHAAGHAVHVVASRYFAPLDHPDRDIYSAAPWTRTVVDHSRGLSAGLRKLRRNAARIFPPSSGAFGFRQAVWAHHSGCGPLARAAVAVKADLYIGHCLAGLVAAASAAARSGARYAFDAEDFHSAETAAAENDPVEAAVIRTIERSLLPGCAHLTAASDEIGRAYRDTYGLATTPVTVRNVFPAGHAPSAPAAGAQIERTARLYWFSQTIGPGRGLEPLMAVLGRLEHPCSLHLRGLPAPGFRELLGRHAEKANFRGLIEWLDFSAPSEMVRLCADYDLGLSLEQSSPRNRDLCLTNKVFTYLLAGLPVAMTPTTAQTSLATTLGAAAQILDLSAPDAAAAKLDAWLRSSAARDSARAAAWKLGRETFNWEQEQARLIAVISRY